MGVKPRQGPSDAGRDVELRRPAERADARAVQVDQRGVSDPASTAASLLDDRVDPHRGADVGDRVVNDDRCVLAKVVDVRTRRAMVLVQATQDAGDAVADVEIGLLLPSVA